MGNEKKLDLSTANMQGMTRRALRGAIAADIAKGSSWSSVYLGDGIWSQANNPAVEICFYTPKIGEVFAHIRDAKIVSIVLSKDNEKGLFRKHEEIDFTNGNKEIVYLTFEKTMKGGVYKGFGLSDYKEGTYIRVPPELWAKAEKQRDIFLSSLNALNYSINIDEPFNS